MFFLRKPVYCLSSLLLVACGGHEKAEDNDTGAATNTETDADTDTDSDTDTDTDSDTDTDTTPSDVPEDNISNALEQCEILEDLLPDGRDAWRDPEAYPNQLIAGQELERYTLQAPEAVCNDGSPAVLYVRRYTDEAFKDVWQLHLQGGGACSNWASCAIRWCGLGYYDASKMSAAWAPEEVGALGIMDGDPKSYNWLKGANHVFFYYCSSDGWAGQGTMSLQVADLEALAEQEDISVLEGVDLSGLPDYTLFRRGHNIIESAINELEAGIKSDIGGEEMPLLSDASQVLLNGTSAGSSGARTHLDWLADRLSPNGTQVYGLFDANIVPRTEDFPLDLQAAVTESLVSAWDTMVALHDVPPFVDESCEAEYGGTENAWYCYDGTWTMFNHITTPFFVRQDLRDISDFAERVEISEDDHEVAVAQMLTDLRDTSTNGVYGPNCGQHVALETNDWWYSATVEDENDDEYTFQAAVLAWYQGQLPALVDEPLVGSGDGPNSHCATIIEER